jgi:hypothetical protein
LLGQSRLFRSLLLPVERQGLSTGRNVIAATQSSTTSEGAAEPALAQFGLLKQKRRALSTA